MYSKITDSKFYSFFLVLTFLIGFQVSSEAQMTVVNNGPCTIYVTVAQNDLTTATPCDLCAATVGSSILPGATVSFPVNISCGPEQWHGVRWATGLGVPGNYSRNPVLGGACGGNILGAACFGGGGTTANWITGGFGGPVTVIIN